MKITNVDEKVRTGRFFYDFSFDELVEVLKEIKTESIENYHTMMPYAQALYDYISKNGFVVTTLSRCMGDVRMSLIEELIDRVLNNTVVCLPCNIGDTIYVGKYNTITNEFDIVTRTVKNIRYDAVDNAFMISDGEFYREFGKKVFLTREEAENCLNR